MQNGNPKRAYEEGTGFGERGCCVRVCVVCVWREGKLGMREKEAFGVDVPFLYFFWLF